MLTLFSEPPSHFLRPRGGVYRCTVLHAAGLKVGSLSSMCFLQPLRMLCKNQAGSSHFSSKLPLGVNYLIEDLLAPKGKRLALDGVVGPFPGFIANWNDERCV